jgi:hypothetical protein
MGKQHVSLGPKAYSRWLLNELEGSAAAFQNPTSIPTWFKENENSKES